MISWNKYPLFSDRLLAFSITAGLNDLELIKISQLDKTQCDTATSSRYYEMFRQAADGGLPYAMCMCARCCTIGWGTPQSNDDAFRWAKRVAEIGFPPGHFELGMCYERGIGVSKDQDQARRHYELAVDGGFAPAALQLANLHHSSEFGARDMAKALAWAKRAYELNEPLAPGLIANWFEGGDGVIRNQREAALWYQRAAELGNFFASERLSRAHSLGELGLSIDAEMARKYSAMYDSQLPTM